MSDDLVKRLRKFDWVLDELEVVDEAADRIEELETKLAKAVKERDEALNQLDSARHSVDVLEKRVKTFCDGWGVADKGRIEAETNLAKAVEALEFYGKLIGEKHECPWHMNSDDFGEKARATLEELKGGDQ